MPTPDSRFVSASPEDMSRRGWCYCGEAEAFDNMIGCDNKDCKIHAVVSLVMLKVGQRQNTKG